MRQTDSLEVLLEFCCLSEEELRGGIATRTRREEAMPSIHDFEETWGASPHNHEMEEMWGGIATQPHVSWRGIATQP